MHVWNKNQLFKMSLGVEIFLYKDFFYNCIPKSKANVLINLK